MFATLLESRRIVRWSIGDGALSLIAHAAVVSAAVVVTGTTNGAASGEFAPSAPPAERVTYATVEEAGSAPVTRVARRVRRIVAPTDAPSGIPDIPAIPETITTEQLATLLDQDLVSFTADLERIVVRTDEFERMGDAGRDQRRRAALAALAARPTGTPWHAAEVERMAVPYDDNPRPRYPFSLLSMGVEGNVVVQFVVDSTGKADMRSLRVLRSTHDLFARAVRAVLPKMRFLPAEVGGNRVDVLVEQPFQFSVR